MTVAILSDQEYGGPDRAAVFRPAPAGPGSVCAAGLNLCRSIVARTSHPAGIMRCRTPFVASDVAVQ
jgi:hypothetical protein